MTKFTFKREPRETGLAAIAHPHANVQVKLDKKVVGYIAGPNRFSSNKGWQLNLMVEDEKSSCGWVWIRMARQDETEEEARAWAQRQAANIVAKYKLYSQED